MASGRLGQGGFELNRAPEVVGEFEFAPEIYLVDSTIRSLQSTVSGSRHTARDLVEIGLLVDKLGVRELLVNLSWRDGPEVIEGLAAARPAAKVVGTFRARHPASRELLRTGIDVGADEICIESAIDVAYLEEAAQRLGDAGLTASHAFAEKHSWDELMELSHAASRLGYRSLSFHDSYFRMGVTPEAMKAFIRKMRAAIPGHPPLYVHLSNFYGQATMTAVSAILAGATAVDVCLNQCGHHCGHTSLGEVAMVLEDLYSVTTGINLSLMTEAIHAVTERTGIPIAMTKSVIGDLAFMIDGADWASEAHLPPENRMHSGLPFAPDHVGAREQIVWSDRTATVQSIAVKLSSLDLPSSPEAAGIGLELLAAAVRDKTEYPAFLTDHSFEAVLRAGIH